MKRYRFCCCAYLFSCHRTASDANYWRVRTLFITIIISWLEKSAPAKEVPVIQSMDVFELLPNEFTACSKLLSRDNHRKAFYPRTQQRSQTAMEPRSCYQGKSVAAFTLFGYAAE